LNIEVGVVGVHLAREHAAKLEARNTLLEVLQVTYDFTDGVRIVFVDGHIEEFARIAEPPR
jgi:hypothetical protein